jgi:hypothetical protein
MESLSSESRTIYEILKADTWEEYETRFLTHKKEVLDVVKVSIDETRLQIQGVSDAINSVHYSMEVELADARNSIGLELDSVKSSLTWRSPNPRPQLTAPSVRFRALRREDHRSRPPGCRGLALSAPMGTTVHLHPGG